jgi:hypothetical protein
MHVISIGSECNVKYQIEKHIGKVETLFFDWLMTDIASVIKLLKCESIDDILIVDSIKVDPVTPIVDSNSRILITSLPNCISIHDIPINPSHKDIIDFIDKYKRRYQRIIDIINSNEPIYFIRHNRIDEKSKQIFIQTIKNINKKCNFKLITIKDSQPSNRTIYSNNIIEIDITTIPPLIKDWTTDWLNWKSFFDIITF